MAVDHGARCSADPELRSHAGRHVQPTGLTGLDPCLQITVSAPRGHYDAPLSYSEAGAMAGLRPVARVATIAEILDECAA